MSGSQSAAMRLPGADSQVISSRLVHLEDRRSGRPPQPVRAAVETGGQDDRLAEACIGCRGQEVVEVLGADGHAVGQLPRIEDQAVFVGFDLTLGHFDEVVDADGAHQGFGEWVFDQRVRAT